MVRREKDGASRGRECLRTLATPQAPCPPRLQGPSQISPQTESPLLTQALASTGQTATVPGTVPGASDTQMMPRPYVYM